MPERSFVYLSDVHWDELDAMQMLHNARFPAHVERAVTAMYRAIGKSWRPNADENPDQFHVVRALNIEYLNPVIGPGPMRIEIWVDRLGTTSCTHAFRCTSPDGGVVHAQGTRTIVKLDPKTRTPVPWSTDVSQWGAGAPAGAAAHHRS